MLDNTCVPEVQYSTSVDPPDISVCNRLRVRRTGRSSRRIRLATLTIATLVATASVEAQETGTVRGTVTLAENGGPVDGALILVMGTGAFTFTDDGAFEFTNVPAGTYDVIAQREQLTAGFQAVTIDAGETAVVDFELSLSPVREEVTVTAAATVGAAATLQAFNAVSTVDSFEIAREAPTPSAKPSNTSRASPTAVSVPARAGRSSAASAAIGCSSSRTDSPPATSPPPRIITG